MRGIIFDCEIQRAILGRGEIPSSNIEYADGWHDFAGMGISCITAIDTLTQAPHVFLQDNFEDFVTLLETREWAISFNGNAFDLPLLAAHGICLDPKRHFDLALAIWSSAGVPVAIHPRGLGLDALCRVSGISGKRGHGARAPYLAQTGQIGSLVDYCLGDTFATAELLDRIRTTGGVKDPRPSTEWRDSSGWIPVEVPR